MGYFYLIKTVIFLEEHNGSLCTEVIRLKTKVCNMWDDGSNNLISKPYFQIRLSTRIQIVCRYKHFHFGERIQMFPDKLLEIVRYVRPNSLSAAEKLRIQKYQDMCGRGLGESHFVLVTRYCTSYSIQVRYHQVKVKVWLLFCVFIG